MLFTISFIIINVKVDDYIRYVKAVVQEKIIQVEYSGLDVLDRH